MSPVDCLGLHGGVPPGVQDVDVVCGGEVQTLSTCLERDQEQPTVGVFLEMVDPSLSIGRAAIEVLVRRSLGVEMLPQDGEKTGELAKHQHLVTFIGNLVELPKEGFELGAWLIFCRGIDEAGMTGRLPQSQQRLQNRDSRSSNPHAADPTGELLPVVFPQFVVGLPLFGAELHDECLFGLLWEVGEHLVFGSPQQIGPHRSGDDIGCRPSAAARQKTPEARGGAKLTGIEKLEDAPKFADVVFHGSTSHRQAMASAKQTAGLCCLATGILNRLGFVEHNVVKLQLAMLNSIATKCAVGGQDQISGGEAFGVFSTGGARVVDHRELGREASRLFHPVEDQTLGYDHQRGPMA